MTSEEISEALEYLYENGMTNWQLDQLHHKESKETFNAARKYWADKAARGTEPQTRSAEYGKRLVFVMQEHKVKAGDFDQFVSKALIRYPIEH